MFLNFYKINIKHVFFIYDTANLHRTYVQEGTKLYFIYLL